MKKSSVLLILGVLLILLLKVNIHLEKATDSCYNPDLQSVTGPFPVEASSIKPPKTVVQLQEERAELKKCNVSRQIAVRNLKIINNSLLVSYLLSCVLLILFEYMHIPKRLELIVLILLLHTLFIFKQIFDIPLIVLFSILDLIPALFSNAFSFIFLMIVYPILYYVYRYLLPDKKALELTALFFSVIMIIPIFIFLILAVFFIIPNAHIDDVGIGVLIMLLVIPVLLLPLILTIFLSSVLYKKLVKHINTLLI